MPIKFRRLRRGLWLFIILLTLSPLTSPALAQINLPANDGLEYYHRLLQVSGIAGDHSSFTLRPVTPDSKISARHPWQANIYYDQPPLNFMPVDLGELNFYEPVWFQSYNTRLPRGTNDGAVWQGRGYNTAISAGFKTTYGPLHIQFRPQIGMAQNSEFDLGPYDPPMIRASSQDYRGEASEFAYRDFRGSIDYVQRYGDKTYSWADLGHSSVELRYYGFRIAYSNTPIWSGPAVHTSLHFGYSAPGFQHLYLGTYRPQKTPIGAFEWAYIFGGTHKSDYFDIDGEFPRRQSVNSLIVSYSPRFLNGLTLGAVRTFFHPFPSSFSEYRGQASKLFEAVVRAGLRSEDNPSGYDPDNQLASGFIRWILPEAGLEIYGEYGRNDHNVDFRDFRLQPNHHRAYSLGMIKTLVLPKNRFLGLNLEINQLEAMRTTITRGNNHLGGWYTHTQQVLGFTNRGQIMGTGYGPGMNMQMLKADLYDPAGRISIKLARIAYHNSRVDQYFRFIEEVNPADVEHSEVRNFEFLAGAEATAFLKYGIELTASLEQSFIFNHHNIRGNDITNTRLELILRKQIRGWKR